MRITTLVAATLCVGSFVGVATAAAQEGQLSSEAGLQAPDDTVGLAPQAKIVASWPRVARVLSSGTAVPGPPAVPRSATLRAEGGPSPAVSSAPIADGVVRESIASNIGAFLTKSLPQPRPGQTVTLSSVGSSDVDGEIVKYEWRVSYAVGNAAVSEVYSDPTVTVKTAANTTEVTATLMVTDNDGRTSAAGIRVPVVANQPPKLDLKRSRQILQCATKLSVTVPTGTPVIPKSIPIAPGPKPDFINALSAVRDQPVTLYANGCDPDGDIVRYEFFEEHPTAADPQAVGYEVLDKPPTNLDSTQFVPDRNAETRKKARYGVRAFDDEGAMTVVGLEVPVRKNCAAGPQTIGYLKVTPMTACVEPAKPSDKSKPQSISINGDGGTFRVNGVEFSVPKSSNASAGVISFAPSVFPAGVARIDLPAATVTALSPGGARLDLPGGKIQWETNKKGELVGISGTGGTLSGLPITALSKAQLAVPKGGSFSLRFAADIVAAAPAEFGPSSTNTAPVPFTASPTGLASAAVSVPPFEVGPEDLSIGPVAINNATLKYSGDDDWDIAGDIQLSDPIALPFTLNAKAGIRNGAFAYLDASTDFPGNGVPIPGTGVNVDTLRFTLDYAGVIESTCVPNIGKKKQDNAAVRKLLQDFGGYSDAAVYQIAPDYLFDYDVPKFQACGAVGFNTDAMPLPNRRLAEGTLGVGVADYANYSVFRIVGKPLKVVGYPADLLFELYDDGYVNAEANVTLEFDKKMRVRAGLEFRAKLPKFNASAYAEVCVLVMDIGCADAQTILSNKGIGACYSIDVAFFEFSPGATYVFGGAFTPYLDGCDIGDVKVAIKPTGGPTVTKLPPPGSTTAVAAQAPPPDQTRVEPGTNRSLPLAPGSTGAVFTVKGIGGLPKFVLAPPAGKAFPTITVDDVPSQSRIFRPINPTRRGEVPYRVLKSASTGITSVIIPRAPSGDWTVTLAGDSKPAEVVRLGEGVPPPKAAGSIRRITGAPAERGLSLALLDKRTDVVARVVETGASGTQELASIPLTANTTTRKAIRFLPQARHAEPRDVVVYFERNGLPVGVKRVGALVAGGRRIGSFMASSPPPPPAVKGLSMKSARNVLRVRWDKVPGAKEYEVAISTNDGRRLFARTRATQLIRKLPFAKFNAAKVRVRAISRLGRGGPIANDQVGPRAARPRVTFGAAERKALARLRKL